MSDQPRSVNVHHSINYIELPATDLSATKDFFRAVFGWEFQDWGPAYISFSGAGVDGGFELSPPTPSPSAPQRGVLVVLYSDNLPATLESVGHAGGEIIRPTYEFPGGRRFHFLDPNGNELAVWSP
ncbi:MAG: VOC family protein [Acidimicrobiales bacterium]|nr:VOC family protein [Acidimicrobiales bacterium]